MNVHRCPYCKVPLVRSGKDQVFPDRHAGAWYSLAQYDCPRCHTTRLIGPRRALGEAEVKRRNLPPLDGLAEL